MSNVDRIKELLRERDLTYVDVAAEIGVTPQAVYEIVHGKTTSATARYAFAKALGLTVGDIWHDTVAA